jgi:hypothetical protein
MAVGCQLSAFGQSLALPFWRTAESRRPIAFSFQFSKIGPSTSSGQAHYRKIHVSKVRGQFQQRFLAGGIDVVQIISHRAKSDNGFDMVIAPTSVVSGGNQYDDRFPPKDVATVGFSFT